MFGRVFSESVHFSRGDQAGTGGLLSLSRYSSCPPKPMVSMLSLPAFPRYMVDAADQEKIEASKNELHNLLDKPQLQGIPVSRRWSGWGERKVVRSHGGEKKLRAVVVLLP